MENSKQNKDKNIGTAKHGIKFDDNKARWDLIPMPQLSRVVIAINEFLPNGSLAELGILTRMPDTAKIYNLIMKLMRSWCVGVRFAPGTKCENLALIAFLITYIIRGKSYTPEELLRCTNDLERWDLIDSDTLNQLAELYAHGAVKYDDNNWMLINKSRYHSAFFRHFKCLMTNEKFDTENGFDHMISALWNIISLMWFDDKANEPSKEIKSVASMVNKLSDKISVATINHKRKSIVHHFSIKGNWRTACGLKSKAIKINCTHNAKLVTCKVCKKSINKR